MSRPGYSNNVPSDADIERERVRQLEHEADIAASDEVDDFRVKERIADVVAIMSDFRRRRLRHMLDHPLKVFSDDGEGMPESLTTEAEAHAILRELNLA